MADPTSKGGSLPLVRTSLLSTPSAGTPRNAPSPAVMLTKVSISFSNPRNSKKGPHGLDFANAKSVFDCLAGLAPTSPLMPEKGTLRLGLHRTLTWPFRNVRFAVRHSPPLSLAISLLLSRCPYSASCHADEGQHQHSPSEPKDGYSTITQRTEKPKTFIF